MPELPEVESISRLLRTQIIGRTIKRVDVLDKKIFEDTSLADFQTAMVGQSIDVVSRRGKFLVFVLNNGFRMTTHLRMTGSYLFVDKKISSMLDKHVRLVVYFDDGSQLIFKDMRRFGRIKIYAPQIEIEDFNKLGLEPLGSDYTVQYLQKRIGHRKIPVKQLLLDQRVVAGIGNIYAAEILFEAGIFPLKPANKLKRMELARLVKATGVILNKAIQCLGTTFSDYLTPEGEKGNFQECLQVYGRADQLCFTCGTIIKRVVLAQRSTFYCPKCQK